MYGVAGLIVCLLLFYCCIYFTFVVIVAATKFGCECVVFYSMNKEEFHYIEVVKKDFAEERLQAFVVIVEKDSCLANSLRNGHIYQFKSKKKINVFFEEKK